MNEIIETVCRLIDFSNMFLVIMGEDGKIASIGNRVSKHINHPENFVELNGKNWFDFVVPIDRERVQGEYNEIILNKDLCKETIYGISGETSGAIQIKWIISYVNHEYNLVLSIGIPVSKDETEFERIRNYYSEIIAKDRTNIQSIKDESQKLYNKVEVECQQGE